MSSQYSAPAPQTQVTIQRLDTLQALVDLGGFNPAIGLGVEVLTILLPPGPGNPAQVVRRALRLTPNLESLVLDIAAPMPEMLLVALAFPKLKRFSTSLSHTIIAPFIYAHPSITTLVLRCRNCDNCPIRGMDFRNLRELQCTSVCFNAGIAHERVCAPLFRLPLIPISAVLNRQFPALHLRSLVIHYSSNEYDILSRLATVVPNVIKLKLNEKPHLQQHGQAGGRAWKNIPQWHRTLMRFPLLEELMFHTSACVSGPTRSEMSVVCAWANGLARPATPHPSLFRIALIQKEFGSGQQRMSHWFKSGRGEWQCVSANTVSPNFGFAL